MSFFTVQKLNIETEQLQNVEEIVKNEFETVEGVQENVALENGGEGNFVYFLLGGNTV